MIPAEYIEIIKSKASLQSFFSNTCLEALKKNKVFNRLAKESDCNILEPNFKFTEEKLNGSCSTLLFTLKAYSIADQTQNIPISQMTSQELAANFVKMFFSFDSLNKDTLNKNMDLLDQFYEMHKDDLAVVEAYLGYIMIAQQITDENQYNSKLSSILNSQKGESFKVDRLAAIKEVMQNDISKAKETLDELNSYYSKEAELQYYYAAYYWRKNDRSMANTYLDKAIKMSKNCSYCAPSMYLHTKKRIAKAEYGDKTLFSISIGLNFENL